MRAVDLLGVGATRSSEGGRGGHQLAREAIGAALADAHLSAEEVTAVTVGGDGDGAEVLAALGRVPARPRAICVSGVAAVPVAWQAVASGTCDVALCVGWQAGAIDGAALAELASAARRYMDASGATEAHFAGVAAKNRAHGARNPRALLRSALSAEEALASELLDWPLRRLTVAPPAYGAAAAVLAAAERPPRRGPRPLRVRCSVVVRDPGGDLGIAARGAARLAYRTAGIGPEDVDCAEVDHPTAAGEIASYEALQIVPEGQGPELVESGFTALGGVLPVNTSGGPLAQGRAEGASAVAQLCELAWQLRGQAGARQVAGARMAIGLGGELHEEGSGVAAASLTVLSAG